MATTSKLYPISTRKHSTSERLPSRFAPVQAVRRNIERLPEDFMFQLTWEEASDVRSQSVILKRGQNVKYLPYASTEQGGRHGQR
ncbi:MAG: ORF6N domain-containing protein [Burkholderiales bacterium]